MKFTIMDKIKYPLYFNKVVRYIPCERNTFDRREKISTVIISYKDSSNIEYRKALHKKSYTPISEFVIAKVLNK